MSSYKMAMMGDPMSVTVFRVLGIDTHEIESMDTEKISIAGKLLQKWIKSGEYGAIFVTEVLLEHFDEIIESVAYDFLPSIILIPEISGSKGLAESIVRETLKKAAGRDIMAEE